MNPYAEQRFSEVYQVHMPSVYAYFKRRTDVQTAQDAAAETFLVAWRRIDRMPEEDRVLPWLYSIARRVLANQYRGQRRRARLAEKVGAATPDPTPTPETIVIRNREHEEVLSALTRLKPDDQELLRLAVWEELPHRLIAETLSCTRHAVDQRIYRASKRLAREMRHAGHIPVSGTTPDEKTGIQR